VLLFKGEGLSLVLTPGQRADCAQFEAVMERIRVPRPATGRPRTTPDSVSADKGHSNRRARAYPRGRGIRHVIPEKADQAAGRLRRGRTGGRPPGFDKERYAKRTTVERAINKLKQFRAVATGYGKRAYVHRGTVTAAALAIRLRS
jgi:transposase